MYEQLTSFVLGYHGCDAAVAATVVASGGHLRPSANEYDWLGKGIYFWEHNPARALDWASELRDHPRRARQPVAVPDIVGAVIDLGLCLNLLSAAGLGEVSEAYRRFADAQRVAGRPMPANRGGTDLLLRDLDNAVIEFLHAERAAAGEPQYHTVRAAFAEGDPLYPGAGFAAKNHVQVCVRDRRCIKGYFRVIDPDALPVE